jgi:hypothetical protein
LLRRRLASAKRIEAVLKPEVAAVLIGLRERTGPTYSAIIEGLLLAEHARDAGSNGLHCPRLGRRMGAQAG